MKAKILYEDRDIIVCHKPAGIAVQSAGVGSMDMVSELKRYMKQTDREPYLGIVHRLDQPVEGIIVFAKTPKAAAELSRQVSSGNITNLEQIKKQRDKMMKKIYHAEVYGHLPKTAGELQDYLVKDSASNTSYVVDVLDSRESGLTECIENGRENGSLKDLENDRNHRKSEKNRKEAPKWSYLTYKVLERREETDLVEIHLFTGRHHQIRVQFSHAGYPLVGDVKYASEDSAEYNLKKNIRTVSLKAVKLEFTHPASGKRMEFSIDALC